MGAWRAAAMPDEHVRFLENLQPSFTCGDFFFAHAGVRPGIALELQREDDLFWIREEFLNSEEDFGKYVVHGHTPHWSETPLVSQDGRVIGFDGRFSRYWSPVPNDSGPIGATVALLPELTA